MSEALEMLLRSPEGGDLRRNRVSAGYMTFQKANYGDVTRRRALEPAPKDGRDRRCPAKSMGLSSMMISADVIRARNIWHGPRFTLCK